MSDSEGFRDKGSAYLFGALLLGGVVLFLLWVTDNSTELTPSHDELWAVALLVGAAVTVISFALLVWLKPALREPRFIAVPAMAFVCGGVAMALTATVGERIWMMVDFSGNPVRGERQFPIERAYISHGKGTHYHIQLGPYFEDFQIDETEYRKVFGKVDDLRPYNYCLQAPIEQNGKALRIMYSSSKTIRTGGVVRCASQALSGGRTFEQILADCDPAMRSRFQESSAGEGSWDPSAAMITNPDWLHRPTGEETSSLYPPEARKAHIPGRALVECVIGSDGWPHDCVAREETPPGNGFGQAAVQLMLGTRMMPMRKDCVPVDGGRFITHVNFAM